MEFIAELPYKSPRLGGQGASTHFPVLLQYSKPFMIRRRRRLRDRQKRMIGLILRTTLHVHPLFCTFSLPSLHIYDVKMPNFMLYDEIFLFFLNVHMDV